MLWRVGGALPFVLAVITVVASGVSFSNLRDGLAFETRGVETRAEIIERYSKQVRRDDRTETEYYVRYEYFAEGATQQARAKVSRSEYEAIVVGTPRTVRYVQDQPRKVEFRIGKTMKEGRTTRWIALALGLATLAAIWWKGGRAVDAIRARKFGAIERVTVLDVLVHQHKNSTSYQLQWFDKNGDIATSLSSSGRSRYDPYPKHASVEIYRGAKGRAWWIGDVGPRSEHPPVPDAGKS